MVVGRIQNFSFVAVNITIEQTFHYKYIELKFLPKIPLNSLYRKLYHIVKVSM